MIAFPSLRLSNTPFVHAVAGDFLPRDLYAELLQSFPQCPANVSPTGYSLFRGDGEYDRLMASHPAWKTLYDSVHRQAYVDYCAGQFGDANNAAGGRLDLRTAHYVDHVETRKEKTLGASEVAGHGPDDLWVRMDVAQALPGYRNPPHVDHRRRAVTLLIYFSDADECHMSGGELVLYGRRGGLLTRAATIAPRHNLAIAFPCSPDSVHAVRRIRSASAPRQHIQIQLSASRDLWPVGRVATHAPTRLGRGLWKLVGSLQQ